MTAGVWPSSWLAEQGISTAQSQIALVLGTLVVIDLVWMGFTLGAVYRRWGGRRARAWVPVARYAEMARITQSPIAVVVTARSLAAVGVVVALVALIVSADGAIVDGVIADAALSREADAYAPTLAIAGAAVAAVGTAIAWVAWIVHARRLGLDHALPVGLPVIAAVAPGVWTALVGWGSWGTSAVVGPVRAGGDGVRGSGGSGPAATESVPLVSGSVGSGPLSSVADSASDADLASSGESVSEYVPESVPESRSARTTPLVERDSQPATTASLPVIIAEEAWPPAGDALPPARDALPPAGDVWPPARDGAGDGAGSNGWPPAGDDAWPPATAPDTVPIPRTSPYASLAPRELEPVEPGWEVTTGQLPVRKSAFTGVVEEVPTGDLPEPPLDNFEPPAFLLDMVPSEGFGVISVAEQDEDLDFLGLSGVDGASADLPHADSPAGDSPVEALDAAADSTSVPTSVPTAVPDAAPPAPVAIDIASDPLSPYMRGGAAAPPPAPVLPVLVAPATTAPPVTTASAARPVTSPVTPSPVTALPPTTAPPVTLPPLATGASAAPPAHVIAPPPPPPPPPPAPAPAPVLEDDRTQISARQREGWELVGPEGASYPIPGVAVVVGRAGGFPPLDGSARLELADATRTISKSHAKLVFEQARWLIEDLGSTNGTFLIDAVGRERRVDPGAPVPVEGRLALGDVELDLRRTGGAA